MVTQQPIDNLPITQNPTLRSPQQRALFRLVAGDMPLFARSCLPLLISLYIAAKFAHAQQRWRQQPVTQCLMSIQNSERDEEEYTNGMCVLSVSDVCAALIC